MYEENSVRFYKTPDEIKLPKQKLERDYDKQLIIDAYSNVVRVNQEKVNQKNISAVLSQIILAMI